MSTELQPADRALVAETYRHVRTSPSKPVVRRFAVGDGFRWIWAFGEAGLPSYKPEQPTIPSMAVWWRLDNYATAPEAWAAALHALHATIVYAVTRGNRGNHQA